MPPLMVLTALSRLLFTVVKSALSFTIESSSAYALSIPTKLMLHNAMTARATCMPLAQLPIFREVLVPPLFSTRTLPRE